MKSEMSVISHYHPIATLAFLARACALHIYSQTLIPAQRMIVERSRTSRPSRTALRVLPSAPPCEWKARGISLGRLTPLEGHARSYRQLHEV